MAASGPVRRVLPASEARSQVRTVRLSPVGRWGCHRAGDPRGLDAVSDLRSPRLTIAPDINQALQAEPKAWTRFPRFPSTYRRIRIAFVEPPDEFEHRLRHLVKRSGKNERFGMARE